MLPDVPLLEILYFYTTNSWIEAWHMLVHVCQKWRNLVFESPRRLNLRLYCRSTTPVMKIIDVWPPIPIIIVDYHLKNSRVDGICAALEHNDRIHEVDLNAIQSSQSERVLAAMNRPFPSLNRLHLAFTDETAPVDPDLFLGGSAPCLQTLSVNGIPASGLPSLLLSAIHLVCLELCGIPHSGYISPTAMVTCLSVLTRLESFTIGFESPRSRPGRNSRPLPSRPGTLLPVLTVLRFKGSSIYMEELVARINVPLLRKLEIVFFHRPIFETPQLTQLISRTRQFKTHQEAFLVFSNWSASISLDGVLEFKILCRQPDQQLRSLAQVCNSSFPQILLPTVWDLYVVPEDGFSQLRWPEDIESSQWLELFRPFTGVEDLSVSRECVPHIASALGTLVGERVTEVLPVLQTLSLEDTFPSESGPIQESIGQFAAARRLVSRLIAVSCWNRELSD